MKKYLLLACLFALFLFGPSLITSVFLSKNTIASHTPAQRPLDAEVLWSLIQTWRQSDDCRPGGCQTYIKDQRLCEIANKRASELAGKYDDDFNHYNLDKYATEIESIIYENITGATSNQNALNRWLASVPHKSTLQKDLQYSCAVVGDTFAVQIFSNFEK